MSTGRDREIAESESFAVSNHFRTSVQKDVVPPVRRRKKCQPNDVRRRIRTSQNQDQFPRRKVYLYLLLWHNTSQHYSGRYQNS